MFEEIWRGRMSEALVHFGEGPIRGELTLVIAGASEESESWDEARVREALAAQMERGLSARDAAALVAAESGWRKREVVALTHQPKE
jgi:16S rRNA (cytidine1402-2'-O)-methyltransferase